MKSDLKRAEMSGRLVRLPRHTAVPGIREVRRTGAALPFRLCSEMASDRSTKSYEVKPTVLDK